MKKFSLPLLTTKKLSPEIIISNGLFVVCAEPCCAIAVLIAPVVTPRPICLALIPPVPVSALAPDADCVVWYIKSRNVTDCDLYPVVLTLAILLPITSIFVWCVLRPATPEKSDLIIIHDLLNHCLRCRLSAPSVIPGHQPPIRSG